METLYLANGVKVHGEIQNVVLTANESTAKIIQHRKQQQSFVNGAESAKVIKLFYKVLKLHKHILIEYDFFFIAVPKVFTNIY